MNNEIETLVSQNTNAKTTSKQFKDRCVDHGRYSHTLEDVSLFSILLMKVSSLFSSKLSWNLHFFVQLNYGKISVYKNQFQIFNSQSEDNALMKFAQKLSVIVRFEFIFLNIILN
jgi:hypoxanthine-guanine phosphoribosyltransferase